MADRPEEFTTWASDETGITEPAGGLKATGWMPDDAPPAQYFNWLFWLGDQWDQWLAQETDRLTMETVRRQIADAVIHQFGSGSILSGSHNWNAAVVGNTGATGLITPRYWVGGDDGAGGMAVAWSASGTSWVDESASAPSGSVQKMAVSGDGLRVMCIGVGGSSDYFLAGTSNSAGTVPAGTVLDVVYDPTDNIWLVATTIGVYSSPVAAIAWTLEINGTGTSLYSRDGVVYALDTASGARLRTRATGGVWTTVSTTAVTGTVQEIYVCDEGIVIRTSTPHLYLSVDDGVMFTQVTPAASVVTAEISEGPTVWNGVLCTEGIYISHGLADENWRGVGFSAGVGERLWGSEHGPAVATQGSDAVIIFPAIHLPGRAYAS